MKALIAGLARFVPLRGCKWGWGLLGHDAQDAVVVRRGGAAAVAIARADVDEAVGTLDDIAPQLDAACEGEWSTEKLLEVGERIWNLERDFNLRAGLTGKDDTLPRRLRKDAAKTGPAKGMVNELDSMLPRYYEIRGWTAEGELTAETRQRLNL